MIADFEKTLKLLDFKPGKDKDCLQKEYSGGQSVTVNFALRKIDYGNKIQVDEQSVTNFSQPENLVVLECVDRLLMKGYQPEHILLQKRWPLGRTGKSGIADIVVRGRDEQTLLIIECKTWGAEFEKEKTRMQKNGGQLFSYFQQDRSAAFLCLYASRAEKKIEMQNALVDVRDADEHRKREEKNGKRFVYRNANDVPGLVEVWENRSQKAFLPSGIFDADVEAYSPGFKPIKIRDLREFFDEDRGKVYGEFEEILRHNNISDRSNAFNRVISLILAKIVDEEKKENDTADFQIMEGGDIPETVQERLETLYSKAMREYLKEDVVNHTESEIADIVSHFPRQKAQKEIRKIMRELKFYKNNEFAFKEVYNERLFQENAKVLFEVVKLFSPYRFRYGRKAQFLGDFFELMLESGYKQTEGQFFTPTPIARFIVSSLPLRKIIQDKLHRGESDFLPYVVDYACGSGHFLTEAIEKIQNIIKHESADIFAGLPDSRSKRINANFADYKKSTRWAGDYIFGIEKDYRLARTSQVSCFMHGDGDANIIFGDGLIHYEKKPGKRLPKHAFDALVANPPYSIKDFVPHLRDVADDDYELLSHIGASSDDIEVLFLERAAQLLRPGGVAGIFMPSSILANSGVYRHARELMLRYFEMTAIAEFGGETFAKTGTNTVILFLRRRKGDYEENCRYIAEDFIRDNHSRPEDFADSEAVFAAYAAHRGFDLADYKTFAARAPGESILQSAFYKSLREKFESGRELKSLKSRVSFRQLSAADRKQEIEDAFFNWALARETEKFFAYLLCHRLTDSGDGKRAFTPQKTLVIKSGATAADRKNFLGYSFSERRGYKGIELATDENGKHITKLYDADDDNNLTKINTHIRRAFLGKEVGAIDSELTENLRPIHLHDAMDFEADDFEFRINLQESKRTAVQSKWPTAKLGDICEIKIGGTPHRNRQEFWRDGKNLWLSIAEMDGNIIADTKEKINGLGVEKSNAKLVKKGTTLLSFKLSIGKTAIAGRDLYTNEAIAALSPKDKRTVLDGYLFAAFNARYVNLESVGLKAFGKSLNSRNLREIEIPLPPISVQREIVAEFDAINSDAENHRREITSLRNQVGGIFNKVTQKAKKIQFGKFSKLEYGKSLPASRRIPGKYPVMGSNGIDGYHSEYLIKGPAVIVGRKGSAGQVTFVTENCWPIDTTFYLAPDERKIKLEFAYHLLLSLNLERLAGGVGVPGLNRNDVYGLEVPLPPIADQNKAIEKIGRLDASIKAAQTQIAQAQPKKKAALMKRL